MGCRTVAMLHYRPMLYGRHEWRAIGESSGHQKIVRKGRKWGLQTNESKWSRCLAPTALGLQWNRCISSFDVLLTYFAVRVISPRAQADKWKLRMIT